MDDAAVAASATLTEEELGALSNADRTLEEGNAVLGQIDERDGGKAVARRFDESLRVKHTLDGLDTQVSNRLPVDLRTISILVNCEYRLYDLNRGTPLRNNPFLSHWVETIQRLDRDFARGVGSVEERDPVLETNASRVELVKMLLRNGDLNVCKRMTPRQLHAALVGKERKDVFDVGIYVRMLEEEGIYERKTPTLKARDGVDEGAMPEATENGPRNRKIQAHERPPSTTDSFQRTLRIEPETAIRQLTRLPIDLPSLDFLTNLLQTDTLSSRSIDTAPIIADYIQHALRVIEQMGQPLPSSPSSSTTPSSSSAFSPTTSPNGDFGRDAQARAVKLLLLFMRNLIKKSLVPVEAIYFEIQEICVRFVWIREVRAFRAFLEEGWEEGSTVF